MESNESSSSASQQQQLQHPQQPQLPPGFRFHPTDEELVIHYLKKKASSAPLPVTIITEVDLYKFDPWELPGKASFGEQEWYFFSPRERKYPNGARPNRAATSGYWKATGTDKPILTGGGTQKVGVKKALVFYGGKPPKGIKTNWIMHEYRLVDGTGTTTSSSNNNSSAKITAATSSSSSKKNSLRLDDWVLCRIYKKSSNANSVNNNNNMKRPMEEYSPMDDMNSAPTMQRPQFRAPTNYTALLDNDDNFFQGLLTAEEGGLAAASPMNNQLVNAYAAFPFKRPVVVDARFEDLGKRFRHNNTGSNSSSTAAENNNNNNNNNNTDGQAITTELLGHQLPMVGPIGDGDGVILRHSYQLSGMNWNT